MLPVTAVFSRDNTGSEPVLNARMSITFPTGVENWNLASTFSTVTVLLFALFNVVPNADVNPVNEVVVSIEF